MLDIAEPVHYGDSSPMKPSSSIAHVAIASFVGTAIEWYDFFLYGTAAALVFNRLFFPKFDPLVGTVLAFATFAVGFVARPVGGVVFGHYGDRIGRKAMLSLTLLIMGVATFAIGILPTYAQIGVYAPILLVTLRLVQGFGLGGEWGGAVLMAIEHAPPDRRGFYGSWPQTGAPAGLLLSTGVFALVSRLPEDAFLRWGWRVPFLASVALVGVGTLIRVRLAESPAFARSKKESPAARLPIVEVLRHHRRSVFLSMGARLAENAFFYIYTTFVLAYATEEIKVTRQTVLTGVLVLLPRRHRTRRAPRDRHRGRRRGRARGDVRAAGELLLGALRDPRPVQRRVARLSARVRAGRRTVAADCRGAAPLDARGVVGDRGVHDRSREHHAGLGLSGRRDEPRRSGRRTAAGLRTCCAATKSLTDTISGRT